MEKILETDAKVCDQRNCGMAPRINAGAKESLRFRGWVWEDRREGLEVGRSSLSGELLSMAAAWSRLGRK